MVKQESSEEDQSSSQAAPEETSTYTSTVKARFERKAGEEQTNSTLQGRSSKSSDAEGERYSERKRLSEEKQGNQQVCLFAFCFYKCTWLLVGLNQGTRTFIFVCA